MDGRAAAVGIRGADLGVSFVAVSKLWLVFGDTTGPPGGPPANQPVVGSSSVIESQLPFNCSSYVWLTSGGGFYQPLHSARKAGSDESTVPAGGVTLNGDIYIYSMRVSHWGSDTDPTHAHGVLFKRIQGLFTEVASWPTDQLFVNSAPLEGEFSDGARAVFIVTSAQYRDSPIYLSYALPQDIEKPANYHYLGGYDQNGSPLWVSEMAEAKPIPGLENVRVGELSFLYDAPLKTYLLMFVDYSDKVPPLDIYSSSTPYGPFDGPEKLYPCGSGPNDRPRWMQKAWGGCYGGYMLPNSFGADGHELLFTFSLWNPYTTVLMKTQINPLPKETASKTPISAQSTVTTPTQAVTHTISATTLQTPQSGSGTISYYALVVLVIAAVTAAVALTYRSRRRPVSSQH